MAINTYILAAVLLQASWILCLQLSLSAASTPYETACAPVPAAAKSPKPAPVPALAPAPAIDKPAASNKCCYKYKSVRVCLNPDTPVGACQKTCNNTTICCTGTGAGLSSGSYSPPPPAAKCCVCYQGYRLCLGPQARPKDFAHCSREICGKYTVCFAKDKKCAVGNA